MRNIILSYLWTNMNVLTRALTNLAVGFTLEMPLQSPVKVHQIAEAWKYISNKDRAFWNEAARQDKIRYDELRKTYTGWAIPKRRAKKHPLAPKRPMSAFLQFSQTRRRLVKKQNPDMSNTDVSRLLGEMRHNSPESERAPYIEREIEERAVYKVAIAKWKFEHEQQKMEKENSPDCVLLLMEDLDKPAPSTAISYQYGGNPRYDAPPTFGRNGREEYYNSNVTHHGGPAGNRIHQDNEEAVHPDAGLYRNFHGTAGTPRRHDIEQAVHPGASLYRNFQGTTYHPTSVGMHRHDVAPGKYKLRRRIDLDRLSILDNPKICDQCTSLFLCSSGPAVQRWTASILQ